MRYSLKFKLDCIRKKKEGKFVETPTGVKRKTFTTKLGTWIRIYDKLGVKGLKHDKMPLTVLERIEIVKRIELGESVTEVGLSFGRGSSLVSKWYKIYRQYGIDSLKSLKRGRKKKMKKPSKDKNKSELEQLREENEYLRAENEYLKKLRALIQEEEKDQPPSKK